MSEGFDRDHGGRQVATAPGGAPPLHQPTGAGLGVGKLTRVQAEMGAKPTRPGAVPSTPTAAGLAGRAAPFVAPAPTSALSLGPDNEAARNVSPQVPQPNGAHAEMADAAQQHVSRVPSASQLSVQSVQPAVQSVQPVQPPGLNMQFEIEHKQGPFTLRVKFMRKDGATALVTDKAASEVGCATIETKTKIDEIKAVLSAKALKLQTTVISQEASVTLFEGMKVTVKFAAGEVKIPVDYSLLKLTVEGAATNVPWFDAMLGALASELRVDVTVSGSFAIDKALLQKIMAQLVPFEKAAEKVAALTEEIDDTRRKLEAAKKARDAAHAEQALAQKAEGAAAKAKKVAFNAERAAAKAERVAVTAEARAVAQAERATARAALATARADVKAAQIASNAASKLLRIEKTALAQQQRALKALLPRLKSATSAMKTAASGIKGMLAKQIGARIGKVLATKAGQALLKAIPVVGWVLLAADVYKIASWLANLPWDGGRFYGLDGAGAGDATGGGTPSAAGAPTDVNSAGAGARRDSSVDGGADADGGEVDRGVAGAGTTGVDPTGVAKTQSSTATAATTPATPTATPTTSVPTPRREPTLAPSTSGAAHADNPPVVSVPQAETSARVRSGGQREHGPAPQVTSHGKRGSGGSDGREGNRGSAATAAEPQQPVTVSATGSSAQIGATASERPDVATTATKHANDDDHAAAAKDDQARPTGPTTPVSLPIPAPASSPAQSKEIKRKAKLKAERRAKAGTEAAQRKQVANEMADRRLFWGTAEQALAVVHWDGASLTQNVKVLNANIAAMQRQPRLASNGAQVALRRMQVTIGETMGTQIPVEVRYLVEQQQGARWIACTQDVQVLLFDIPSKQLRVAGIGMHAVLFDGGVLQVKNGSVVKARETFTMAGIGTFEVKDFKSVSFADHWALTVILRPLSIQNPKAIFHVDGGEWHELGSAKVNRDGIIVTLKHAKSTR